MSKLSDSLDKIEKEYTEKYPLYERLCSELVKQLEQLLLQAGVTTAVPIEFRVKKWNSIRKNCENYNVIPNKLEEISDLAGLRIVLIFLKDIDRVCNIIEDIFDVLEKEDTTDRLLDNIFGYGSIHYKLLPPAIWFSVPTLSGLKGLQFELQVRTGSQHIWATASHILQYKHEDDVPIPIRRSINRVAALLETVDLEFERVLSERGKYIDSIEKEELLNTDSLKNLLERLFPTDNIMVAEPFANLLDELRFLEISSIDQLEQIIKKHWSSIEKSEKEKVTAEKEKLEKGKTVDNLERTRKGVFFTHAGLARNALRLEFGQKYNQYMTGELAREVLDK